MLWMEKAKVIRTQAKRITAASRQGSSRLMQVQMQAAYMLLQPTLSANPHEPSHLNSMHIHTHVHSHLHTHPTLGSSNTNLEMTVSFANSFTCQLPFPGAWAGAEFAMGSLEGRQGYMVTPAGLPGQPGLCLYS